MRRRLLLASALLLSGCMLGSSPPRTIVVFFTADSASLDSAAQASIKQAADSLKSSPAATAHVRGFAAPDTGTVAFNKALAQTRAQAVADALASAGVAQSRISVESRGPVAFELMPTESRRVEIVIGS